MENPKLHEMNIVPIDTELDSELQKSEAIAEQEESENFVLKIDSRRDERILAFYLIYAMDRFDYSISFDDVVRDFQEGFSVTIPARSFSVIVAQGAIEEREKLDEKLKPYLKNWKLERLGCCTKLILRLALWELEQPNAISSIVINEAVELAKMFAEKDAYKFINGILDEMYQKPEVPEVVEKPAGIVHTEVGKEKPAKKAKKKITAELPEEVLEEEVLEKPKKAKTKIKK